MEFWWWLTSWAGGACQRVHGMEWYTKLRRVKVFESEISWSLFLEKLAVISTIPFTLQFFVLHDEIRAFWFGIVGHYKYISLPVQQDYHKIFGALWTTHVLGVVGVRSSSDSWFRCLRFALKSWCVLCQRWRRQTSKPWLLESDGAWQTRWWFQMFFNFHPLYLGNDMSESPKKPPGVRCFDFKRGILPWWRCMRSSRKFQRLNIRCHVVVLGLLFSGDWWDFCWKWTISMASSKGCSNVWPLKRKFQHLAGIKDQIPYPVLSFCYLGLWCQFLAPPFWDYRPKRLSIYQYLSVTCALRGFGLVV